MVPREHLKATIYLSKENGDIAFTGSSGTQAFYDFREKEETIYGIYPNGTFSKCMKALKAGSPASILLKQKIDSIINLGRTLYWSTILNTDCAYLALIILSYSPSSNTTYTGKEYNLLRKKFEDNFETIRQINLIDNLQAHPISTKPNPSNGTYLANFTLPDINSNQVSLALFKGKYTLIDFWASWCSPCRSQSPYLKKVNQQFGGKQFTIVSISIDKDHQSFKKAISEDGTQEFVHLIDTRGSKNSVSDRNNITGIPSNFLIDPTGKIIAQDLKGDELIKKIAEITRNQ
jgi:thiol-disulfide isomerase/thioredoxin